MTGKAKDDPIGSVETSVDPVLSRYRDNLPERPYCGKTKQLTLNFGLPKDEAVAFPYIQTNVPWLVHYLVFDCDYEGAAYGNERHELPRPTLAVVNPKNAHAHLIYEVDAVPIEHVSKKTACLLHDVKKGVGEMLCADKVITVQKQLCKNALSPDWNILEHDRVYKLNELIEYVPKGFINNLRHVHASANPAAGERKFADCVCAYSRNVTLFDYGRYVAYAAVGAFSDYDLFFTCVYERLKQSNHVDLLKYFPSPLPSREIRDICKSICRWTWKNRQKFKSARSACNVGAMGLESMKGKYWQPDMFDAEVKTRRVLAAEYATAARQAKVRAAIKQAVQECFVGGVPVSIRMIANRTGLSKPTIYKHKDLL
jgi:hypothetical protein